VSSLKKSVIGRYFGIFLAMLGLIFGSITIASPAYASQALCGNYGDTPSFGCVSSSGFSGQRPWGYPVDSNGHNCTNYVTYRLSQNGANNPGNLGNAYEWDNKASSYGLPVDNTPNVGSVAVWEINSWPAQGSGHVAYVEAVTSTYIDISEDNYNGTTMQRRYFVGQSDWPDHFAHIKDVAASTTPMSGVSSQVTPDGVQHAYTASANGGINDTSWGNGAPLVNWSVGNVGTQITSIISKITSDGVQHVYAGTSTGGVWDVSWGNGTQPTKWQVWNAGTSITSVSSQVTPDGVQHVYAATGTTVRDISWGNGAPLTQWQVGSLGAQVNSVSSKITSDGVQHVYAGTSTGVVDISWGNGAPLTQWQVWNAGTSITSVTSQVVSGVQHVYSLTNSGAVWDVSWGNGTPLTQWRVF
jgi:hypothetical protein